MSVYNYDSETKWLWGILILSVLAIVIAAVMGSTGHTADLAVPGIDKRDVQVIDGDTIRIGSTSYRLMGFDTPETFQAKCPEELAKGTAARIKLVDLITSAKLLELDPAGQDKYHRTLGRLYVDKIDVSVIMVATGHAVPYNGRTKRQSWC